MNRTWLEKTKDAVLVILVINFLGDVVSNFTHRRPPMRSFGTRLNNGYDTNRMEILETRVDDLEIRVMEMNAIFDKP